MSRVISSEDTKEIKRRYLAGESASAIGRSFGVTGACIIYQARLMNLPRRGNRKRRFSTAERREIIRRYRDGEGSRSLGPAFGVTDVTIATHLKEWGIPMHGPRRRIHFNERFFEKRSPCADYWLGFLMADGGVNGTQLELTLSECDGQQVKDFLRFLGSRHKIRRKPERQIGKYICKPCLTTCVSCQTLVHDLVRYGVVPKKSLTAKASGGAEFDRHFWRGVIDGDGSVQIGTCKMQPHTCAIRLVGSKAIISQFLAFVRQNLGIELPMSHRKNIWATSSYSVKAMRIATLLYGDLRGAPALPRKLIVADAMIASLKAREQE